MLLTLVRIMFRGALFLIPAVIAWVWGWLTGRSTAEDELREADAENAELREDLQSFAEQFTTSMTEMNAALADVVQQPVYSEPELRMRLGEHGLRDLQIDLVVAQADEFGVEWDS